MSLESGGEVEEVSVRIINTRQLECENFIFKTLRINQK